MGSVLIGKKDFIKKARRIRKVFGGGMRQAGFLAAAGIYALKNNIERLKQDHDTCKANGECDCKKSIARSVLPVETNIIIFETYSTAAEIVAKLKEKDILCYAIAPDRVRLVVHLEYLKKWSIKQLKL